MTPRLSGLFAALCLLGVVSAVPAQAQAPVVIWSMPGSTCEWDQGAAENALRVDLASAQHKGSAKGLIALNCPIMNYGAAVGEEEEPWLLGLTYQDSTGTDTKASVKAQLYRMPLVATVETDVKPSRLGGAPGAPELVTEANSNTSSIKTINTVMKGFNHTFDFENYTYWVHVELLRSSGNQTVIFHAAFLQENPR